MRQKVAKILRASCPLDDTGYIDRRAKKKVYNEWKSCPRPQRNKLRLTRQAIAKQAKVHHGKQASGDREVSR